MNSTDPKKATVHYRIYPVIWWTLASIYRPYHVSLSLRVGFPWRASLWWRFCFPVAVVTFFQNFNVLEGTWRWTAVSEGCRWHLIATRSGWCIARCDGQTTVSFRLRDFSSWWLCVSFVQFYLPFLLICFEESRSCACCIFCVNHAKSAFSSSFWPHLCYGMECGSFNLPVSTWFSCWF